MSGDAPFFSVLTPSWNQAAWIEGCITSVLAQGVGDDFEHLVFDNCSTDGTAEILARFPHLRCTSEPDRGQAHALNKALALARGEIICWLNADDQYLPGALARVRREMAQPGVDVVFGDAQEVFFDGRPAGVRRARFERREDFLFWWEKRVDLLQPAVFFRRSAIERVGPLREDLHFIMDTELWWRLSECFAFHRIAVPLALQQRQPESKTIRQVASIYEEKARVFTPLLDAAGPRRRWRTRAARRAGMGRRWLGLAQSAAAAKDAEAARDFLARSRKANPLLLLAPRWWRAWAFLHRQSSRS